MDYLGKHYLAELFDCSYDCLNDKDLLEKVMVKSVELSGATLIKPFFHLFSPHGVSGIVVVAESHYAIHTWPEHNYAAVDLFSCGDFDYMAALDHIAASMGCRDFTLSVVNRGNLTKKGPLSIEEIKSEKN